MGAQTQFMPVVGSQRCVLFAELTHTPVQQPGVGVQGALRAAQTAGFTHTQLAPSVHGWVVFEAMAQTSSAAQHPAVVVHDPPVLPQVGASHAPVVVLHVRSVQQSADAAQGIATPEQSGGGSAQTPSRHFSVGVLQHSASAPQA